MSTKKPHVSWDNRVLLAFIRSFSDTAGFQPSHRDCERFMGVGSSVIQDKLRSLREEHFVSWLPRQARTLQLTQLGEVVADIFLEHEGEGFQQRVNRHILESGYADAGDV